MPSFSYLLDGHVVKQRIPNANDYAISGIKWGRPDISFSPAFWLTQYWMHEHELEDRCFRFGDTLIEETVACVLGGYSIRAEVAQAVFKRLRSSGLLNGHIPDIHLIHDVLLEPVLIGNHFTKYRFAHRKAQHIVSILSNFVDRPVPEDSPSALRAYLVSLPGIGLKTASWIVRNWLDASEVAILDIHIIRAGRFMGLFDSSMRIERDYIEMEQRFLDLARAMLVHASKLDFLIWTQMRRSPRTVSWLLERL
jgi:N-glycosylase/DNA lyase